jgi:hypothetical protein
MVRARSLSFVVTSGCALLVAACGANNAKGEGTPFDGGGSIDAADASASFDVSEPGLDVGEGDSNTFDPDAACAAKSFGSTKIPLALALVFDQSGSMSSDSRMTIAKAGVKKALSDPKFDDVAVGLFRFGYTTGLNGCTWDTTPTAAPVPLSTGRTELFKEIDKLAPSGSTPTYSALNAAYGWLSPKVLAKTPPEDGKVAIILVTDGAPTCGTETPDDYVALVAKGRKATIDTFIIGLPGSAEDFSFDDPSLGNTAAVMSKMAAVGTDEANLPTGCDKDPKPITSPPAKPCYFDMSKGVSTDALAAALDNIRKAASSCEYILPTGDASYDSSRPGIYVTDGKGARVEIPHCTDPTTPGPLGCWDWSDSTHTRVKILGAGCDTVKLDDKATVDILLPCRVK